MHSDTALPLLVDLGPATEAGPGRARLPRPTTTRRDLPSPGWPRGSRHLRFGGDYNPEQWSRDVWAEDVALMHEAGVNLVSLGIFSWALLEPSEGVYDFAWLDEVMDLLATAGVDVDLGTPTAAPPAWFWRRYPQARPVTRDGVALGFGSRGMASPSAPEYRRAAANITAKLAEHYSGHPALVMWHVHNEYGAPITESYDDSSVLAFRSWLRTRYGDLDGVNLAWGTTFWGQQYSDWDEIDAPRRSASVSNPAQRVDFARFSSDALLACFTAERDVIRRCTPDLPVTTNFMASTCPSIDYWAWAREVDVVSNDHYLVAERTDNHVLLALDADLTRSLAGGSPWMLMEHSTSAVNWQPRNLAKRAGEMARNSLTHLARGADSIMFFQFRASRFGAEKFHSAMLPHAGTDSRVWREVLALGADLARLEPLRGTRVRARVALVWDWQSFWAQDLEWQPSAEVSHRERIEAFYTALWSRAITVDFVHPSADLSAYDLVLAPSLYAVSAESGRNLTSFVRRGGHLLVSYASGLVDEFDAVPAGGFPGPLREPLGVTIEEFLPFPHGERAPLDNGGTGSVWADDLRLTTAQPVLRFTAGRAEDRAAVTRNEFGAGLGWYVSTRLDGESMDDLLDRVLADAGIGFIRPDDGMEVVERVGDAGRFRFYINHTDIDRSVDVSGLEMLTGAVVDRRLHVPGGAVRIVHLPSGG